MAATEEYKQTHDIWTSRLWLRHELIVSLLPLKTIQISQGVWNNNKIPIEHNLSLLIKRIYYNFEA